MEELKKSIKAVETDIADLHNRAIVLQVSIQDHQEEMYIDSKEYADIIKKIESLTKLHSVLKDASDIKEQIVSLDL